MVMDEIDTCIINQAIQDFQVKYQESSVGFENLAYLQSIENKCKRSHTKNACIATSTCIDMFLCRHA